MNKEDRTAVLALPVVLLLGVWFTVIIGSNEWGAVNFATALVPVGLAFLLQFVAFVPAWLYRTEKFYDLVGGMSFICVAIVCLLLAPIRDLHAFVLLTMVVLWAGRLGFFLFIRVHRFNKDSRFDAIKQSFPRFLFAWMTQGLWITFTLAPTIAVMLSDKPREPGLFFFAGSLVWLFGYVFEVTADVQKFRFKSRLENKGRFIHSGLWSFSRHPNYFGEIVLWTGVALIALPLLSGWQYFCLTSPLFVYCLLNYISGIPILERSADRRWGHLESYQSYKRQVPVLVPAFQRTS